jgi:hypothetical protein
MLQMISHGLIGASLFFLVGATYDRTHTLQLDEMGGVGQKMRKMFALWTGLLPCLPGPAGHEWICVGADGVCGLCHRRRLHPALPDRRATGWLPSA